MVNKTSIEKSYKKYKDEGLKIVGKNEFDQYFELYLKVIKIFNS
jgi:hypothetical protein